MTTTDLIEIITDDIKRPYGLYVSFFKNKKGDHLVIRISKNAIEEIGADYKPLSNADGAIEI